MTMLEDPTTLTEFPPDQYASGDNPDEVKSKVPFAMPDSLRVPKERYYDRDFFELEKKHLWPKTWQMAARLEEIPNPGDYTEYEIVGQSVLVIRQKDGSVKALHNACRHRATELAKGCGRLPGGQIVCPFHGWRWNLDGSSSHVFIEEAFDPSCLSPEDLRLRECKVEVWANMVWINFDLNAPPLAEALAPVQGILDGAGVGNMRVKWWKKIILNANWKIALEAFLEGYHVMQTHPQLLQGAGLDFAQRQALGTQYTAFRGGHGRFMSPPKKDDGKPVRMSGWNLDDFIESNRLLAQGQDAMALDREVQIFEGVRNKIGVDNPDAIQEAIKALFEYSAGAGIPLSPPSEHISWGGEIFLFPNFLMLPMYSNCLTYRARPYNDDPEWCEFELTSLMTYPSGQEPERAELLGTFDKDDDENWGLIPRQDISNIERQQRGVRSYGYEYNRLSPRFEKNIANLHQELDRVIAADLS